MLAYAHFLPLNLCEINTVVLVYSIFNLAYAAAEPTLHLAVKGVYIKNI